MPIRLVSFVFSVFLVGSCAAQTNPAREIVEAVTKTATALGKSVEDTIDTITGERTPALIRKEIDQAEKAALLRFFKAVPGSRAFFDHSHGYAVFDSSKKSFIIASASGAGVTIDRKRRKRTYMRMASLGATIGAGLQYYQVIFLFENAASLNEFVEHGWEAEGSASAVFGKNIVGADLRYTNGKAVYLMNETGIMLGADLSGTKYWSDSALNSETKS